MWHLSGARASFRVGDSELGAGKYRFKANILCCRVGAAAPTRSRTRRTRRRGVAAEPEYECGASPTRQRRALLTACAVYLDIKHNKRACDINGIVFKRYQALAAAHAPPRRPVSDVGVPAAGVGAWAPPSTRHRHVPLHPSRHMCL